MSTRRGSSALGGRSFRVRRAEQAEAGHPLRGKPRRGQTGLPVRPHRRPRVPHHQYASHQPYTLIGAHRNRHSKSRNSAYLLVDSPVVAPYS